MDAPIEPGELSSREAAALNTAMAVAEAMAHGVRVAGGGSVADGGGLVAVADDDAWFFARLTSRVGAVYGWEEVFPAADGTWITPDFGRSGTTGTNPAYETSGNATIGLPSIVKIRPGAWSDSHGQEYLFTHCCTGTVSGSGSGGGGGGVTTACCPDLPTTLTATITDGIGCSCMVTTLSLVWNGMIWYGGTTVCSGKTLTIQLSCATGGSSCANMAAYVVCGGEELLEVAALGCTCDPLSLEWTLSIDAVGCCTSPGDTATLTITE